MSATAGHGTEAPDQLLFADIAATVRRHIARAEHDAAQCRAGLVKIRDEAMEDDGCRWCRESEHIYSCPAGIAGSYLAWCARRAAPVTPDWIERLRDLLGCDMMDMTHDDVINRAVQLKERAEKAEAALREMRQ